MFTLFPAIDVCVPVRGDRRENSVSVKFDSSETPDDLAETGLSQQNTLDADRKRRSCLEKKIKLVYFSVNCQEPKD